MFEDFLKFHEDFFYKTLENNFSVLPSFERFL